MNFSYLSPPPAVHSLCHPGTPSSTQTPTYTK